MQDEAQQWREKLLDSVSNYSDEITELYFAGEDIPEDLIISVLRKCTTERDLLPVFCGSSLKDIGVQCLLDGIVDLLPSPDDIPPATGIHLKKDKEEEVQVKNDFTFVTGSQIGKELVNHDQISLVRIFLGEGHHHIFNELLVVLDCIEVRHIEGNASFIEVFLNEAE